jgi:hypothetical protein
MNEFGTLVTKMESMQSRKRKRDAFDMFVAIVQARDRAKTQKLLSDFGSEGVVGKLHSLHTDRVEIQYGHPLIV